MSIEIYVGQILRAWSALFGRKGSVTVELLQENGHLTQAAFVALNVGALHEQQRIAVSEHLCTCDACLARYTESLCGEVLLAPTQPLAPGIAAALARRTGQARNLCGKSLAVAACFAAGLWLVAMLAAPARKKPQQIDPAVTGVHETLLTQENSTV